MNNFLNSDKTLWQNVKMDIEILIIKGHYKAGDKLPILDKLASMHNVSLGTMRAVIQSLYADDTLIRKPSVGYYVKPYVVSILKEKYKKLFLSQLNNITENIKRFDFNNGDINDFCDILNQLMKEREL